MEEIDMLRVEHSNDVTTIHELRMCLEDEKRGWSLTIARDTCCTLVCDPLDLRLFFPRD